MRSFVIGILRIHVFRVKLQPGPVWLLGEIYFLAPGSRVIPSGRRRVPRAVCQHYRHGAYGALPTTGRVNTLQFEVNARSYFAITSSSRTPFATSCSGGCQEHRGLYIAPALSAHRRAQIRPTYRELCRSANVLCEYEE